MDSKWTPNLFKGSIGEAIQCGKPHKQISYLRTNLLLKIFLCLAVIVSAVYLSACRAQNVPELPPDEVFSPPPGLVPEENGLDITVIGLDAKLICTGSTARITSDGDNCESGNEVVDAIVTLASCREQGITISYIGNNGKPTTLLGNFDTTGFTTCDSDDQTSANELSNELAKSWANSSLLNDFNEWKGLIRCRLNSEAGRTNCKDPSLPQNVAIACPGGGTARWEISMTVSTSGVGATTVFTYDGCTETVSGGATLSVTGTYTGWFNTQGNSDDANGQFTITGSYEGFIKDEVNIEHSDEASGYYEVTCLLNPLDGKDCRPNNQSVRFNVVGPGRYE